MPELTPSPTPTPLGSIKKVIQNSASDPFYGAMMLVPAAPGQTPMSNIPPAQDIPEGRGDALMAGGIRGAAFGFSDQVYNFLPQEVRERLLKAEEEHPGMANFGALVTSLLPTSTISLATRTLGGAFKAARAAAGVAGTEAKLLPNAGKGFIKGFVKPSATAGALAQTGLAKNEGMDWTEAVSSGAISFGAQKLTDFALFGTRGLSGESGKGGLNGTFSKLTRDDILEMAKNPEIYRALRDKSVAELLDTPVTTGAKIIETVKSNEARSRIVTGEGQLMFMARLRRVFGEDFRKQATKTISDLGNPDIDMTKPMMDVQKVLVDDLDVPLGPKGQATRETVTDLRERGFDPEVAKIYTRLINEGRAAEIIESPIVGPKGEKIVTRIEGVLPSPKQMSLSELSKLKQTLAESTDFTAHDKANKINVRIYGILNDAVREQAPDYFALTQKYSEGLQSIDNYRDIWRAGKTPGDPVVDLAGSGSKAENRRADLELKTSNVKDKVQFNDKGVQQIFDEAFPQQVSHIDAAVDRAQILKKIPAEKAQLARFFMNQPLDNLRNETFIQFVETSKDLGIKQVYKRVVQYKVMSRVFGVVDDAVQAAKSASGGLGPTAVISPKGAAIYATSEKIKKAPIAGNVALMMPEVVLLVKKAQDVLRGLNADTNPFIARILGNSFSPKSFARNLPIILRSETQIKKLEAIVNRAKSYQSQVSQDQTGAMYQIGGPIEEGTPMDLNTPEGRSQVNEQFTEEQ